MSVDQTGLVLLGVFSGYAISKVVDVVVSAVEEKQAKRSEEAQHNARDSRCKHWTGDRSGGIGLDREICKVCNDDEEEDS